MAWLENLAVAEVYKKLLGADDVVAGLKSKIRFICHLWRNFKLKVFSGQNQMNQGAVRYGDLSNIGRAANGI